MVRIPVRGLAWPQQSFVRDPAEKEDFRE